MKYKIIDFTVTSNIWGPSIYTFTYIKSIHIFKVKDRKKCVFHVYLKTVLIKKKFILLKNFSKNMSRCNYEI